jgi:hypothetical protein
VLGGGTAGDGFGSDDAWQWQNFPAGLSTPGATYSTYAFQLFASLPWWSLRPSGTAAGYAGKKLITAGGGTKGQTDYVTSALTQDGAYLLAYIPTPAAGDTSARTITVDMTAMQGPTRARWFNPATGLFTDIGSGLANSGTQSFTSPGDNGTGTNDWLLVLDAAPPPTDFYTLTPCRAVDTRSTDGPALAANKSRTFALAGARCFIPADAVALATNLTVVGATASGNLRLYPTGNDAPLASAINFTAGQTRANNAVARLGSSGRIDVLCTMPSGSTDFVLDVSGYFK